MTQMNSDAVTIIAPGTKISGEMHFEGPAAVLGELEGSVKSSDRVEIGESATVSAAIEADTVLVNGKILGDVVARDRLEMSATAKLEGDVTARTLIVSEGASFVGHCTVGADVERAGQKTGGVAMGLAGAESGDLGALNGASQLAESKLGERDLSARLGG